MIIVNVTAATLVSGKYCYTGTQQEWWSYYNTYADGDVPITFSSTTAKLVELNNVLLTSFGSGNGVNVRAYPKGMDSDGNPIYEFDSQYIAPAISSGLYILDGVTITNTPWTTVGTITLPSAGNYHLCYDITTRLTISSGGSAYHLIRMAAVIGMSESNMAGCERRGATLAGAGDNYAHASMTLPCFNTAGGGGALTYKVQVARFDTGTPVIVNSYCCNATYTDIAYGLFN